MKKQSLITTGSLFCLSLSMIACGDKASTNPLDRPTAATGTLSAAMASTFDESDTFKGFQAAAVGAADASSINSTNPLSGGLGNKLFFKNAAQALALKSRLGLKKTTSEDDLGNFGCDATPSGTTTDTDEDGIPVDATLSYDCNVLGILTVKGSSTATDKDDDDIYGGFGFNLSDLTMTFTSDEGSGEFKMNADLSSTKSTSSYTVKYDLLLSGSSGGDPFTYGNFIDATISPTDMDAPATSGGTVDSLSGFYKVAGTIEGNSLDLVFAVSSTGLTYASSVDEDCTEGGFNAGSITLTDGSSNTLKATFDGFCAATYTYNDEAIESKAVIK